MPVTNAIPDDLLDAPIQGVNLTGSTLRAQLGDGLTLVLLLRHNGCIFCRQMLTDARSAATGAEFPPVLVVFQGTPAEGRDLIASNWPEVPAMADPDRRLYTALGLRQGSLSEMFAPRVWLCGLRAAVKGHRVGVVVGDPWLMPGCFAVQGGNVLWSHTFQHAADHPDFKAIPSIFAKVRPLAMATG